MRQCIKIQNLLMASLFSLLAYACTDRLEELERLSVAPENTDSRAAGLVTASVTLTQAGTLDTKLGEALGANKLMVQELTISGPFNATDVETLHTLTALEKLNITNLTIVYDNTHPNYVFSYTYEDSNWNTYEGNVNQTLFDNQIGIDMFAGMTFKELIMPKSASIGGYSAFYNTSLTTVTVPEGITTVNGFYNCPTLKTVNLPSTLKEIGSSAFASCTSLENLTIPKGVEKIGSYAFTNTPISTIQLPESLKEIESYAFYGTLLSEVEIPFGVTTLGYNIFYQCSQLKSLTIPSTVTQISGTLIDYCWNLQVLVWNSAANIIGANPNSNCMLYINSVNGTTASYDTDCWLNVIVDGQAEYIQLNSGSYNLACPIAFHAKRVIMIVDFQDVYTYIGKSSGWRTIVLPFDVSSIISESKGELAPFGSGVENTKPFWLRSLTIDGFINESSIKADKPYIIAMPYNPGLYIEEYNISGRVFFIGENVTVQTPSVLPAVEGPEFHFQPTYQHVKKGGLVYALNYNYWIRNYEYGSIFARNSNDVYANEAYLIPKSANGTRAYYEIDSHSADTRSNSSNNTTGIPAIGDMQ